MVLSLCKLIDNGFINRFYGVQNIVRGKCDLPLLGRNSSEEGRSSVVGYGSVPSSVLNILTYLIFH